MANEQLVIAFFENEVAAEETVDAIKQWDKDSKDVKLGAIGILVQDEHGEAKVHKVGKRKTGTGLAIGAVAGVLSGGLSIVGGAIGGAVIGHFFHKNVKLSAALFTTWLRRGSIRRRSSGREGSGEVSE